MYEFSGIYYQMFSDCIVYMLASIVFFTMSRFWKPSKRNNKILVLGIVGSLLIIASVAYYSYAINQADVLVHEGYFKSEYRASKHILKTEYAFSNDEGLDPVFYLDVISKKKIYPERFDTRKKYYVYYEKETNYIVKIEVIE